MISVVMPVYNRRELTKQCLDSLLETLHDTVFDYEIIVIDNGSDYPTRCLLDAYSVYDNLQVIRLDENIGIGAAKNMGVHYAKGDMVYITDNDMKFFPSWLERLMETSWQYPEFVVLGGFKHPHHGLVQKHERDGYVVEESDQQVGSSWLVSRENFYQYGPLKEGSGYGADDTVFCNRVTAAGYHVGAIFPAVVMHCGATNSDGMAAAGAELIKQQQGAVIL